MKKPYLTLFCILFLSFVYGQEPFKKGIHLGIFGGMVNYQGDLQPNSFAFARSKIMSGAWVRIPINNRISIKTGINSGKLGATDAKNRDYLRQRNLSFHSNLQEAFLVADVSLLDMIRTPFTPYVYGGALLFRFNPFTYDQDGQKVHLQPLGTEGQGLAAYPERKPYKLTQAALTFGGGVRFAMNDFLNLGIELGQRKTFTDYLDDVSKTYVAEDLLREGNGDKAAELAFRGDEFHGLSYPEDGSQRGSANDVDWYYTVGLSLELKLQSFKTALHERKKAMYNRRCPKIY